MAFGARRVYPNDTRPRVAIGVNLPFSEPGVFQPNYQTRDAIKNNLINYFLTNPGERPGNPTFGAGLRKFIFSSITNENFEFIKEDLQEKVNIFFSNINLEDIEISKNVNANTINVSIKYSIPQTGINDELLLNFS
jgi:phage baseplate assembly protein W|tara:strand:+ start:717 stop:1124 length:408 start_codon:yes stop_codon:yes gene_type:complete